MFKEFAVLHLVVLLVGLVELVAKIWAIVITITDSRIRIRDKVVWVGVLILVPLLGLIIWLFIRAAKHRRNLRPR